MTSDRAFLQSSPASILFVWMFDRDSPYLSGGNINNSIEIQSVIIHH